MRSGLTLIELMVVMAVIALMMGLVLPTLSNARENGRRSVCLNAQHQFGVATAAYVAEHDGRLYLANLPLGACGAVIKDEDTKESWVTTLDPFADGSIERLARCPSDTSPYYQTADPATLRRRSASFGVNSTITAGGPAGQMDTIPLPSALILAGELIERNSMFAVSDRFIESWWDADEATEGYDQQIEADQHGDRSNWLYLDGHATASVKDQVHAVDEHGEWIVNQFRPELAR